MMMDDRRRTMEGGARSIGAGVWAAEDEGWRMDGRTMDGQSMDGWWTTIRYGPITRRRIIIDEDGRWMDDGWMDEDGQ